MAKEMTLNDWAAKDNNAFIVPDDLNLFPAVIATAKGNIYRNNAVLVALNEIRLDHIAVVKARNGTYLSELRIGDFEGWIVAETSTDSYKLASYTVDPNGTVSFTKPVFAKTNSLALAAHLTARYLANSQLDWNDPAAVKDLAGDAMLNFDALAGRIKVKDVFSAEIPPEILSDRHVAVFGEVRILKSGAPVKTVITDGALSSEQLTHYRLDWSNLSDEQQLPLGLASQPLESGEIILPKTCAIAQLLYDFAQAREPIKSIGLVGEAGASKTTMCRQIASLLGLPYYNMSLSESTLYLDLLGTRLPGPDGQLHWQDSPLVSVIRFGGLVELAEINAPKPGELKYFFSLLDGNRTLTLPNNEIVTMHPYCFILATANVGASYVGSRQMDPALISRFAPWQRIEYPERETLIAILQKNLSGAKAAILGDERLRLMLDAFMDIRRRVAEDGLRGVCGTRELQAWAKQAMSTGDISSAGKSLCLVAANFDAEDAQSLYDACIATRFDSQVGQ